MLSFMLKDKVLGTHLQYLLISDISLKSYISSLIMFAKVFRNFEGVGVMQIRSLVGVIIGKEFCNRPSVLVCMLTLIYSQGSAREEANLNLHLLKWV